ncbi:Lethal(2) giant larvae sro7 [Coemansia sp. IMI 203386]|nr:Lethal(2) giant larvae sro7 [Coemansia sp. IMI 203386]
MRNAAATHYADEGASRIDETQNTGPQMLSLVEDRYIDAAADATAMAFDPIQGVLAMGFATGQICLHTYNRTSAKYSISATSIAYLQFIPAKAVLAVIDDQSVLRVFDTHTMEYCFSYAVPSTTTCVSFIPGTPWLLIGTNSGRVYFVDLLEARKSDFSIGCQTKPVVAVATVEPHPIEIEKILISYVSGACVICDIGKASVSTKDMVLSSYFFDGHPEGLGCAPRLACAGWSPNGDMIAVSYENGVFCIFDVGSGFNIAPVVARTIYHDSVMPRSKLFCQIDAEDMDRNTACLGQVHWCTSKQSGRSFLVLTSGPSIVEQKTVHIFGTPGNNGSDSDITILERLELESPMIALCTMPAQSPWKCGNDDVQALLVLVGCPATAQALEFNEDLQLSASQRRLPGDMQWCKKPMTFKICQAKDKVDSRIRRLLDQNSLPQSRLLLRPPDAHKDDPGSEQQGVGSVPGITHILCSADASGMLSLWCTRDGAFSQCTGLGADIDRLSRLLGIRGKACAIGWHASNGLIVVSMDSGESYFFIVTHDPSVSLARSSSCCEDILGLSTEYYANPPPAPSKTSSMEAKLVHTAQRGSRVQSAQIDSGTSKRFSMNTRDRAASLNEGNLIRRSSKRLSTSIGSVFRRKFSQDKGRGSDIPKDAQKDSDNSLQARFHSLRMPSSHKDSAGFDRQMPMDADVWKRRLSKTNKELSKSIYGLKLSADEYQQVVCGSTLYNSERPTSQHARVDSGALGCAEASNSLEQPPQEEQPCVVAPFMMSRFFYREIMNTVVGHDGIAAIIYRGGIVVVVDCVKQEVVLADNINQTPSEQHTAFDIFSGTRVSGDDSEASELHQEITCASFVLMRPRDKSDGQGVVRETEAESEEFLLVGTSAGIVLRYPVEGKVDPPDTIAALDGFSPIIHLSAVEFTEHCQPSTSSEYISSAALGTGLELVVVGSSSAISVLSSKDREEVAKYDAHKTHLNAAFVAASALHLDTGWQGVAAIDTKATVTLLSLPTLAVVDQITLKSARGKIKSAFDVQISKGGYITLLTSEGSLLQARICENTRSRLDMSETRGFSRQADACFFDASLQSPAQPLRKGITSWLFGRSSNAAPDIDAFLGGHYRDLLRMETGGKRPSQAPSSAHASGNERQHKENANEHGFRPRDSRRKLVDDIDMGAFSGMKTMAERRGQELEDIQDSVDRAQIASENYLASIRAYNARQEKKSRLFGLF